jgi:hypothetical protein
MAGMSMMSGIYDSGYNSRTVMIETTGFCQPNGRTSVTTLKVSYQQFSQTLQRIHRQGGKVTQIRVLSSRLNTEVKPLPQAPTPVAQTLAQTATPAAEPARRSPKPKPAAKASTSTPVSQTAASTTSKTRRKSKR